MAVEDNAATVQHLMTMIAEQRTRLARALATMRQDLIDGHLARAFDDFEMAEGALILLKAFRASARPISAELEDGIERSYVAEAQADLDQARRECRDALRVAEETLRNVLTVRKTSRRPPRRTV